MTTTTTPSTNGESLSSANWSLSVVTSEGLWFCDAQEWAPASSPAPSLSQAVLLALLPADRHCAFMVSAGRARALILFSGLGVICSLLFTSPAMRTGRPSGQEFPSVLLTHDCGATCQLAWGHWPGLKALTLRFAAWEQSPEAETLILPPAPNPRGSPTQT